MVLPDAWRYQTLKGALAFEIVDGKLVQMRAGYIAGEVVGWLCR